MTSSVTGVNDFVICQCIFNVGPTKATTSSFAYRIYAWDSKIFRLIKLTQVVALKEYSTLGYRLSKEFPMNCLYKISFARKVPPFR